MAALELRGTSYPVLLPKLRDPRLHLAATITSLQVIGQVGFHFRVSIAQILLALGTSAVLEVAIAFRQQKVILWPASAMLTGNGVAFVLRVPGTQHGDWWTLRGWWIFVGTAAVSLLSKYVIRWRGEHIFNPSNIGLVICFLALGRGRADPLDFWWGPMSWWLGVALAVIVAGGFGILFRLSLLRVALGFWASFAAGIGVLALAGHAMTARWHLGPISGFRFWWVLVTSPEVLVFLFFMITDPKTAPRSGAARLRYAVALGLVGALLIAPTTSEFAAKVALLGSLALVCLALPLLRLVPSPVERRLALAAAPVLVAAFAVASVLSNGSAAAIAFRPLPAGKLPPIQILPSPGVQTQLDRHTADLIAHDLLAVEPASTVDSLKLWLEPGQGQGPPTAVAQLANVTYRLHQAADGSWALGSVAQPTTQVQAAPSRRVAMDFRLTDVAQSVGLDFQQGSFRYGISSDYRAMMGGGVCWLDYNGDGWLDLFAVNSYASSDAARWQAYGGLPRTALFENRHGTFTDVSGQSHAGLAVQGNGCVAADLNGDGRTDLVVTTTSGVDVLWNDGNGTFSYGRLASSGWYAGAAVADVNGDGRPDVFVAGYADPNTPVPDSFAGFPTNLAGVRDLLFLNEGDAGGRSRFGEVGIPAGLESAEPRHGLGAVFTDVNGDGRPDLYVADDEDPNQLYVNVPWPGGARADPAGLGFRFEERAAPEGVDNAFAGMGVAADNSGDGGLSLFVTNSRSQPSAVFRHAPGAAAFADARAAFDPALGAAFAGWGASFVDFANSGEPDLVLAAGAIPVTSLSGDAEPVRLLAPVGRGTFADATSALGSGLRLNGRGLAAADVDNDGHMDVAINTIGGKLALLRPTGPSGHWLDVSLSRFSPGAVVTVALPGGKSMSREIQAGSSYLSSEDPRLHFGLGAATAASVTVRYPWGGESRRSGVRADRVVRVSVPPPELPREPAVPRTYALAGCAPAALNGSSVATAWDETAVAALRDGGASEPVQARDLLQVSAAAWDAWAAYDPAAHGYLVTEKAGAPDVEAARAAAISYAAYRVLLWDASFDSNLERTFGLLTARLRSLCYSPAFTSTAGGSPAALGNRIAAAAIAAGRDDGSLQSLHYLDASYTPLNGPLLLGAAGSTVHDPTFWQPIALGRGAGSGLTAAPTQVQSFADAQWGRVRGFALLASAKGRPLDPGPPHLGVPTSTTFKQAALTAIRATAAAPRPAADASPLAWMELADSLPSTAGPAVRLARDVRLHLALAGSLEDAAIAAWGAKRAYQSPRPISMIRYLAFNGELPIVSGLTRKAGSTIEVRSQGRWIDGARWTPLAPTPASPGWVSADAAFAYAADAVLTGLTGRSFDRQAARASSAGIDDGVELAIDATAGRKIGSEAGKLALARIRRLGP